MKLTMKGTLTGLAALLIATTALASDRQLVIKMFDQHLQGENTIGLKREIKEQFPKIDLKKFTLDSVVLVAKSRKGAGKARLEVDSTQSFIHQIDGTPRDFLDSDAYTFDRILIHNPAYSSRGQWQLHVKGNLKIRKVVVNLNRTSVFDDFEPTPVVRFSEVETLEFSKIYDETKRVRVAEDNVKVLKIKAKRTDLRILEVEVVFKNGNTRILSELEGVLSNGDAREIRFNNPRDLRALRITAVARRTQFGGSGLLKVSVGQLRR